MTKNNIECYFSNAAADELLSNNNTSSTEALPSSPWSLMTVLGSVISGNWNQFLSIQFLPPFLPPFTLPLFLPSIFPFCFHALTDSSHVYNLLQQWSCEYLGSQQQIWNFTNLLLIISVLTSQLSWSGDLWQRTICVSTVKLFSFVCLF